MPHLEKGKRHYCKGVTRKQCIFCEEMVEVPTTKKLAVCTKYSCSLAMEERKRERDRKRAQLKKEKK